MRIIVWLPLLIGGLADVYSVYVIARYRASAQSPSPAPLFPLLMYFGTLSVSFQLHRFGVAATAVAMAVIHILLVIVLPVAIRHSRGGAGR